MARKITASLFVLACAAFCASTAAATEDADSASNDVTTLLAEGKQALAKKDYPAAAESVEQAWELAKDTDDKNLQATILIQSGETAQQQAFAGPDDDRKALLELAEDRFKRAAVLAEGDAALRYVAINDLAIQYVRTGRLPEALERLEALTEYLDSPNIPDAWKAEHTYSLGYCYEKLKRNKDAIKQFSAAALLPATQTKAVAAVFRVLRQLPKRKGIEQTFQLADRWVPGSDPAIATAVDSELVATEMLESLKLWGDDPRSSKLLTIVLRRFAIESLAARDFTEYYLPKLREIGDEKPALNPAIEALVELFAGDFSTPASSEEAAERFAPLLVDDQQRAATSALLTNRGQQALQAGDQQQAERILATAPLLDPGNLEALLYQVVSLVDAPKPDSAVRNRLVDEFLFGLNPLKSRDLKTPAEWRNLVRLCYLLGDSYAREGVFVAAYWPHSAVGQWQLALEADKRARMLDPEGYSPIPGLHVSLAQAYEKTSQTALAWDHHLSSAEAYIELEDGESARAALVEADRIVCRQRLSEDDRHRVELIEAAVRQLP